MAESDAASNTTADAAATEPSWAPTSFATNTSYFVSDVDFPDATFVHQIIIAKIVGLLSAMGSAYIIYSMVINVKDAEERKKKLHRTFDRLLLGLCVSDIISSISIFLGSWYVGSLGFHITHYCGIFQN